MGGCFSKLSSLSPLSFLEIREYYDDYKKFIDRGMFSVCKSLISLPDISKWNTSNIINMNGIF